MSHQHTHTHSPSPVRSVNFALAIGLNVIFVIAEVFYGLKADSSALLADAGHNANDVLSLGFSWLAAWLATRKPKGKYTYGFRRTTILVSILNAILLLIAVGFIVYEAIEKLLTASAVAVPKTIIWVAALGLLINGLTALLFLQGRKNDLNIRAAFLHMASDAGVSFGVVIAGIVILYTHLEWIDPVVSLLIAIAILWSTWHLLVESVNLALDAVPDEIELEEVRGFLRKQPGVEDVHDLHIWAMSTTQIALTAHLVLPAGCPDSFLFDLRDKLSHEFGIGHSTLQVEHTFADEEFRPCC